MQGNADDASESSSGEEEEEDPVVELNNKLKSSISGHKEQLERLKEQDPEFFKYLMETDKGLLDFTTGEGEDGEEGGE